MLPSFLILPLCLPRKTFLPAEGLWAWEFAPCVWVPASAESSLLQMWLWERTKMLEDGLSTHRGVLAEDEVTKCDSLGFLPTFALLPGSTKGFHLVFKVWSLSTSAQFPVVVYALSST